ncbi:MAG: HAD-IC family P-type ATPase, partial [Opitutales bacterium]|nr:HAD-IC family P-type ATPase [Opitutales bacterium]
MNGGLTAIEAEKRLHRDGRNRLTPPRQTPEWVKFVRHLTGGFSLLLWAGSILSFIAYVIDTSLLDNLYLGVVLAVVVFLTGIFSYYQENKSDRIMEGFAKLVPVKAAVRRDGQNVQVDAEELVVGDIVLMRAGDKVPADVRILEASNFKVDNSSLTGESEPQSRIPGMTDENPLETKNLAFYSTLVVDGTATAIVLNTGDRTVIGRIKQLTEVTGNEHTPLHREIASFTKL